MEEEEMKQMVRRFTSCFPTPTPTPTPVTNTPSSNSTASSLSIAPTLQDVELNEPNPSVYPSFNDGFITENSFVSSMNDLKYSISRIPLFQAEQTDGDHITPPQHLMPQPQKQDASRVLQEADVNLMFHALDNAFNENSGSSSNGSICNLNNPTTNENIPIPLGSPNKRKFSMCEDANLSMFAQEGECSSANVDYQGKPTAASPSTSDDRNNKRKRRKSADQGHEDHAEIEVKVLEEKKARFGGKLPPEDVTKLKKLKRLLKNRQAAHQSRLRKKNYIEQLETQIKQLLCEKTSMSSYIFNLQAKQKELTEEVSNLKSTITSLIFQSNNDLMLPHTVNSASQNVIPHQNHHQFQQQQLHHQQQHPHPHPHHSSSNFQTSFLTPSQQQELEQTLNNNNSYYCTGPAQPHRGGGIFNLTP